MLTRRERTPLRKLMFLGAMAGAGALVEDTATGNPLTFITDVSKPLKSLLIPFTPRQSGTGDPSPDNIRPLLPWNGLTVNYIAKNMFTGDVNQSFTRTKEIAFASPIPAGTYTFTATVDSTTTGRYASFGIAKDRNVVVKLVNIPKSGRNSVTFTTSDEITYIYLYADVGWAASGGFTATFNGILIEAGSEPPTNYTSSFPSPVYGGTLDVVSGVLTVTHGVIVKTWGDFSNKTSLGDNTRGTLNISSSPSKPSIQAVDAKCNVALWNTGWSTDSVHFYTNEGSCIVFLPNDTDASTEIQVVYPLDTPRTIQLDHVTITAIVGNNTMWSDADGQMTAVYLKKG